MEINLKQYWELQLSSSSQHGQLTDQLLMLIREQGKKREAESDVDFCFTFGFKWCYQENGTIYNWKMSLKRLQGLIDTAVLPIILRVW